MIKSGRHHVRTLLHSAEGPVKDTETEEESRFRAHEEVQLLEDELEK
jgi:hypothetical protein